MNRITFALCENDCGREAEYVIGGDAFCPECCMNFGKCVGCSTSVLIADAVIDDDGEYRHEACAEQDDNYSEDDAL